MNAVQIPLNQLRPSPRNVRKTTTSVAQLAASIAAHGLIQGLAVEKVDNYFEVVAGGRRLQALRQLASEGRLADDAPISCMIMEGEGVSEVSLAENTIRETMHPADQFEAFQRVLDEGRSIDDVAAHFSVTTGFVRQRMKLAAVSPKILEAYRAGGLDLKAVETYALSDDHAEQEKVFASGGVSEWAVRSALTRKLVPATDKRIAAIGGIEAYESAGGVVTRDLFSTNADVYATDSRLVNKLVAQVLDKKAEKLRADGWSFVDVGADLKEWNYAQVDGKADKTKTGAIVTLAHDGKVKTLTGVLRPADKKAEATKATNAAKKAANPGDLPQDAAEELKASRDARTALHLAKSPKVALAVLAGNFAATFVLERYSQEGVDSFVNIESYSAQELPETDPSAIALKAMETELRKILPRNGSLIAWALQQPTALLERIVAFGVARTIDLGSGYGTDHGIEFAALFGLDPAGAWKPTAEWLGEQTPAYVLEAVRSACGKPAADELALVKAKGAMAAKAAQLLQGAGWLPEPLRGKSYGKKPTPAVAAAKPSPVPKPAKKAASKAPAKKAAKAPAKKVAKKKASK